LPPAPRALVVSIVRGKDAAGILATLAPYFDLVVTTRSRNDRSLPPDTLAALVPSAEPITDPLLALARARAYLSGRGGRGTVVVAGSIFLVGELRAAVLAEECDPVAGGDPLP
jgi:dihydrofolate synthase/folylpolyglutamate synthase